MLLQYSSPSHLDHIKNPLLDSFSKMFEMFGSIFSFLISEISNSDAKAHKVSSKKRVVGRMCRDHEIDQKPLVEQQPKPVTNKAKKRVSFVETKPLVYGEKKNCDVKNGNDQLKVKILMTKEEAARLLAKCKDGGRLEFKDVASELIHIPINRVQVVSSTNHISLIQSVDHKEL